MGATIINNGAIDKMMSDNLTSRENIVIKVKSSSKVIQTMRMTPHDKVSLMADVSFCMRAMSHPEGVRS